jgi:hypothetical protein
MVATEAMLQIDPNRVIQQQYPLAYLSSHLQLRQIARSVCRGLFEDDKPGDGRQHVLFPDLQWRYPAAKSKDREEPEYVLRELQELEDVYYNLSRLRSEARAKLRHADALSAWAKKNSGGASDRRDLNARDEPWDNVSPARELVAKARA